MENLVQMNRWLLVLSLYLVVTNAQYFHSWQSILNITDLNGIVYALLLNPINGDLFVAGNFTSSTKTGAVGRFFGITNNRTTIQTFGTGLNGNVYALCFGATYETVYVGGDFTDANGVSVTSIVQLNTTNGQWIALSGSYTGVAKALVFSTTRNILIAGGNFFNGVNCSAMIWNGTWQASPNSLSDINALMLYPGDIIVGGGSPALNIIQDQGNGIWNETTLNGDSGIVYSLQFDSLTGRVFVGSITSVKSLSSCNANDSAVQRGSFVSHSLAFSNDIYLNQTLVMAGDTIDPIFACNVGSCGVSSSFSKLPTSWFASGKILNSMVIDSNRHELIVGGQFNSAGNVPTFNLAIVSLVPPEKDTRPVCVIGTYTPAGLNTMNALVSTLQLGFTSVSYANFSNSSQPSEFQNCSAAIVTTDGALGFDDSYAAFGNALLTRIQEGMGVVVTQTCMRSNINCFGSSSFVNDSLCAPIGGLSFSVDWNLIDTTSPILDGTEMLRNNVFATVNYIPRNDSIQLASAFGNPAEAALCIRTVPNLVSGSTKILVLNMHPAQNYMEVGSLAPITINSLKFVAPPPPPTPQPTPFPTPAPTPIPLRPCPPYQCPNGTCVNNLADCYSPPSIDYSCFNSPKKYYCSQTSQCESSLSVCSAASLNQTCLGYTCWNGACKSNSSQCDVVPSCSPLFIRCWDGSCVTNTCPLVSNCTLSSKPYRCPDGVCAANVSQCAPFDGCAVGMILCASGTCVQNPSSCYSPNTAQVICQDGTTANSISECVPFIGVYDVPPVSIEFTNISSTVYIPLFSDNNVEQGKLVSALNASSGTFQTNNSSTCNLTISMSILANSVFSGDSMRYTDGNTTFFFTPNSFGMEISIPSCVQVTKPAQISFRVSRNFNVTNKCLAYLNPLRRRWECITNVTFTQITTETGIDYYASGTTPHFSSFAIVEMQTQYIETPPTNSSVLDLNLGMIIGIAVGAFVLVVLIFVIIMLVLKRRNFTSTKKAADEERILMTALGSDPLEHSFGTGDIQKGEKIGGGRFGSVFKGDYQSTHVALKSINSSNVVEFEREASTLRKLRHPNIVWYFGIWMDVDNEKYIVTEFVSGGSLKDLLVKDSSLLQTNCISFSCDIASGMSYLHSQKILHRDLAARNVLVSKENSKWIAKVADFGLAVSENEATPEMQAVRWTAPEALTKSKFSLAADVFSFAITMYEIFSRGLLPYMELKNLEVLEKIPQGYRMSRKVWNSEITIPEMIFELMERCWAQEPTLRPNFEEISTILDKFREDPNSIHDKASENQYLKNEVKNTNSEEIQTLTKSPPSENRSNDYQFAPNLPSEK